MKVQYSNTQTFNTLTQQSKQIFVSYLQNIYKPINRFMDLKIQFNFFSQICGQQEQIIIKDIYDIQLVSSTLPQLTQNFKSFKDNQITIEVKPFSVPINTDLDIQNLVDSFKILNSTTQSISQILTQPSSQQAGITQSTLQTQMDISDQIANLLNNITLPNQGEMDLQGNLISINTEQITSKYLQKYMMIQNKPEQNDSSIFNVVITNYTTNPFQQTPGYQSYLTQLQALSPGIKVSQNSVTKPFIKNVNNTYSPNLDNALLLNFPNVKPSQNNLTCVQLQPQQVWSNSKCKLFKPDKSNVYTCLCDNQQPTTIIEDIQSLYNNNLQTALSSKGLQNISNFKSFYEYAVF
ncbi:hypothetical protein ABPG74_007323 [Tetrahymena malaccensis]